MSYFVYKNDVGLQMIQYEGYDDYAKTPCEAIDKYKADEYKKWFKHNQEIEEFRKACRKKIKESLECDCEYCKNPLYYETSTIDAIYIKYEKCRYQLNKLIEFLKDKGFNREEIIEAMGVTNHVV